jgi:hypothetical protein
MIVACWSQQVCSESSRRSSVVAVPSLFFGSFRGAGLSRCLTRRRAIGRPELEQATPPTMYLDNNELLLADVSVLVISTRSDSRTLQTGYADFRHVRLGEGPLGSSSKTILE